MATAHLTITQLSDDSITVSGQRLGACASCNKNQECSSANLDQQHQLTMVLPRHASAAVGQSVEVNCEEGLLLQALLRLFLPPLLGLCGAPLLLSAFSHAEALLLSASGIGFVVGLICSARLSSHLAKRLHTQALANPQQLQYQICQNDSPADIAKST